MSTAVVGSVPASDGGALGTYFTGKIDMMDIMQRNKQSNLRRLKAQRNELNAKVRALREELQLLQDQPQLQDQQQLQI